MLYRSSHISPCRLPKRFRLPSPMIAEIDGVAPANPNPVGVDDAAVVLNIPFDVLNVYTCPANVPPKFTPK